MAGINFAHWSAADLRPRGRGTEPSEYPSLGLGMIQHRLKEAGRSTVLDLGAVVTENVHWFGQFRTKLFVEEFFRDYICSPHRCAEALEEYLQPYPETLRFDAILIWDLLHYLRHDEVRALFAHLSKYCSDKTLLLGYVSTVSAVAEKPLVFRIRAADKLSLEKRTDETIKRTPLSQGDFTKLMPGWKLCRSLHLRNSFQEHIFQYTPPVHVEAAPIPQKGRSRTSLHRVPQPLTA